MIELLDIVHFFVPVGHIWKFDLEQYEQRNFGVKWNFSKIRIEPVMLNFLAQLKISEIQDQNNRTTIAGK